MTGLNDQSVLVLSSFVFGAILYILTYVKGPRITFLAKNVHIDRSGVPKLLKLLAWTILGSVLIGYAATKDSLVVLQYIGLNLIFGTVMGANLFLIKEKDPKS